MKKIRVLIVDDSVVIRRLVTDILTGDPGIEVAGVAANGRIALEKIPQVNPDIVILDVEMPEMDGLQALKLLRKGYPRLPVIMFSTLTERGASTTMDALALGANDYVAKPANVGSAALGMERVRQDLIPKIKALCGVREPLRLSAAPSAAPALMNAKRSPRAAHHGQQRIDIVAIGVSTGGPNALAELMPGFPSGFPVPIVIAQHMPPIFTRFLADRLNGKTELTVREGIAGAELRAGEAWIAPGDYHMVLGKTAIGARIELQQEPPENSCRPAVDMLFRSVAKVYGAASLAVILTGMGQDGYRGCELIYNAGGQILAQDEASSVVWGMPRFVAQAGLADSVLPLKQIAGEIIRRVAAGREAAPGRKGETLGHGYLRR